MTREIHRRRVLMLLAATGLASLAAGVERADMPDLQWLAEGIDASALRELASHAVSVDSPPLAALLQDSSIAVEQLAPRIRRLVMDDYTHGRTVSLSGWQVSRSEACLYRTLTQAQG